MKKYLLLILILSLSIYAQSTIPKFEHRGVWVATVTNLDWPSRPGLTVAQQKEELTKLFETLKIAGNNVIYFQVRTECDALYSSPHEVWSYYISGVQGKAPNPLYDPLTFAIEEAHKRGMELHAWVNPYRAEKEVGKYAIDSNHISKKHPEWILKVDNYKFLDPGLPEVEEYVVKIFTDIVSRYNVDGLHMDDYFYSYTPITTQDSATFRKYNTDFTDIRDWRRDNVNRLVKRINDTVKVLKPSIKWGISPFGIWKPGKPVGGFDAFNILACDPVAWLQQKTIDYLTPQLYWPIGSPQDFKLLTDWWGDTIDNHPGVHFYPGLAAYKAKDYSQSEMPTEIRYMRSKNNVHGGVWFEAINFPQNPKGFVDSLRIDLYRQPSLNPVFQGKDSIKPVAPTNLRYITDVETGRPSLAWDAPISAVDGDTAHRYVIYRFDHAPTPDEINQGNHIIGLAGVNKLAPQYASYTSSPGNYFVVTALDENSNESSISNVLYHSLNVVAPEAIYPSKYSTNHYDSVKMVWIRMDPNAGGFELQVSKDSSFNSILLSLNEYKDTTFIIRNLEAQITYFWRVKAHGLTGSSNFSEIRSFKTGTPLVPSLIEPPHQGTINTISPVLKWNKAVAATKYQVQFSGIASFSPILKDTTVTDTLLQLKNLSNNKVYYWKVKAINDVGSSAFSSIYGFKVPAITNVNEQGQLPSEFGLFQNYPNPFNPTTTIKYSLKENCKVILKVYDLLGNEVNVLVNEIMPAGTYNVEFNGEKLSSGIYFYSLTAGNFSDIKKFILLK